jgi:hypothetical protein
MTAMARETPGSLTIDCPADRLPVPESPGPIYGGGQLPTDVLFIIVSQSATVRSRNVIIQWASLSPTNKSRQYSASVGYNNDMPL